MKTEPMNPQEAAERYNILPPILFQLQFQKRSFEEEIEEPEYPEPGEEDEGQEG